jgi:ferric-dicitrate binding protein FerR (iron transport regulator)
MNAAGALELERYLAGDMPDAELEAFLARAKRDPHALRSIGEALLEESLVHECLQAEASVRPAPEPCREGARRRRPETLAARQVHRRRGRPVGARRSLALLPLAAAALLAVWLIGPGDPAVPPADKNDPAQLYVAEHTGPGFTVNGTAHDAEALRPGDRLDAPRGCGLTLRSRDGTTFTIEGPTRLALGRAGPGTQLRLERGALAAQVAPMPKDAPLVFRTSQAEVTVVGTHLDVATNGDTTWVRVEAGQVRVAHPRAAAVVLRAGQRAAVIDGVRTTVAATRPRLELDFEHPPHRSWCQDRTPGSTLSYDFVEGRESPAALRVRYRVAPIGRGKQWVWVASNEWFGTRDWSAYGGIAFWVKGTGNGARVGLDLGFGKNAGLVRYSFSFADESSEWRRIEARWCDFGAKLVPGGAEGRGLDVGRIDCVAFVIGGGSGTMLFDDLELVP